MAAPRRLLLLLGVAGGVLALKALRLAQLLGVLPSTAQPARCQQPLAPAAPFAWPSGGAKGDAAVQELAAWLSARGAQVDGVRVAQFGGLRGLQATRDFARHEVVLSIPANATLSGASLAAALRSHGAVRRLLALPDGDTLLEAAALLHAALLHGWRQVRGGAGTRADDERAAGTGLWLATLPRSVPLPVLSEGSGSPCDALAAALPALRRLSLSRAAGLRRAWPTVSALLRALPRPAAATLDRLGACEARRAFAWAYSMAKTRAVALEVGEVPDEGAGRALAALGVEELGVLVPLLDLANHASGDHANARVAGDRAGFQLVAAAPIPAGAEVTMSYAPDGDDAPQCSWRWLLEYGFVPRAPGEPGQTAPRDPRRRCYAFNLTAGELAAACEPSTAAPAAPARRGAEPAVWAELDAARGLPPAVLDWAREALGGAGCGCGCAAGGAGGGGEDEQPRGCVAACVVRRALSARGAALDVARAAARTCPAGGGADCGSDGLCDLDALDDVAADGAAALAAATARLPAAGDAGAWRQAMAQPAAPLPEASMSKVARSGEVYEPSDDSFALVDAVNAWLQGVQDASQLPGLCLEVGCGSGYVICSAALALRALAVRLGAHDARLVATDVNSAAMEATAQTLAAHGVGGVELVQTDLVAALLPRLERAVDLLLFNPPYVPTPDEELARDGIARAWAGGHLGRRVTDRLLAQLPGLLSPRGHAFVVTVADNRPAEIIAALEAAGFGALMADDLDADLLALEAELERAEQLDDELVLQTFEAELSRELAPAAPASNVRRWRRRAAAPATNPRRRQRVRSVTARRCATAASLARPVAMEPVAMDVGAEEVDTHHRAFFSFNPALFLADLSNIALDVAADGLEALEGRLHAAQVLDPSTKAAVSQILAQTCATTLDSTARAAAAFEQYEQLTSLAVPAELFVEQPLPVLPEPVDPQAEEALDAELGQLREQVSQARAGYRALKQQLAALDKDAGTTARRFAAYKPLADTLAAVGQPLLQEAAAIGRLAAKLEPMLSAAAQLAAQRRPADPLAAALAAAGAAGAGAARGGEDGDDDCADGCADDADVDRRVQQLMGDTAASMDALIAANAALQAA
ncbi:N6a [Scenedesmus sp. PABB004]|nr:N6a [Scenedesmus sp. PABB004]